MLKFNCYLPRVFMKLNGVKYGRKLKLLGYPFIFRFSKAQIDIGNNVTFNSGFFSNLLGLYQRSIIVAKKQAKIKIGNNVGASGVTVYSWNSVEIGDNTKIGANVKIIDTDFHPINPEERLVGNNDISLTKPIEIGKNVFIGMNSIILKGTRIGDNCVIGAGSVVSGCFEDNCVIAGNPAKLIRKIDV